MERAEADLAVCETERAKTTATGVALSAYGALRSR
jgi:hypothetical protein